MAPDDDKQPSMPWLPVNKGAEAPVPALPEPVAPSKPTMPAWIQREAVPEPVEAEDAEIVPPVAPPPSDEVLPRVGSEPETDADPTPALTPDLVQQLGESAVASAALSAAGAPTPLGGVPTVRSDAEVELPSFDDGAPLFTPKFGDEKPEPTSKERADAAAAQILAQDQQRLAAAGTELEAGTAYEPLAFGSDAPATTGVLASPSTTPAPATEATDATTASGRRGRLWLWILIALLVVVGAVVAWLLLNRPDPTVVPGATVTEEAPGPTITPIAVPAATAFQGAMPATVGTFALVEATPLDPADGALGAGHVADGIDLTYRSGTDTITVRALQYFTEADATTMFATLAGDAATTAPVVVGGATVGESATVTTPAPGIVWRNGTAVFQAAGPEALVQGFYEQFGL